MTTAASRRSALLDVLRDRTGVLLAVALLAITFATGKAMQLHAAQVWAMLGVEHEGVAFVDLALITGGADCVAHGIDPYVTASCDVWQRIYNYPPIMLLLSRLGVRASHTVPLGLALDFAFLLTLVVVMKARSRAGQAIVFLAVLSYPVLWALERGNVDLVVFIGCVAVCMILERAGWGVLRYVIAAAMLLLLFLAKLYPVAAVTAYWRDRRSVLTSVSVAMVAAVAYVASDPGMIAAVRRLTPFVTERSYGAGVLAGQIYFHVTRNFDDHGVVPRNAQWLTYLLSGVAVALALIAALRHHRTIGRMLDFSPSADLRLALVGVSVYCLTYCVGTNFNYRLMFLTLAVPYFLRGWEERRNALSLSLAVATVALMLLKWQTHYGLEYRRDELVPLLAELVGFTLFTAYAIGIFSVGMYFLTNKKQQPATLPAS
jgi:hypothetical protein